MNSIESADRFEGKNGFKRSHHGKHLPHLIAKDSKVESQSNIIGAGKKIVKEAVASISDALGMKPAESEMHKKGRAAGEGVVDAVARGKTFVKEVAEGVTESASSSLAAGKHAAKRAARSGSSAKHKLSEYANGAVDGVIDATSTK